MPAAISVQAHCAPFDPSAETIAEFFQRFQCQMSDVLQKVRNDDQKRANLLIKALPVNIITDLQRRIAPVLLSDASYDDLETNLMSQFSIKKSTTGAAVKFLSYKQEQGQSIEHYAQTLNNLAAQCEYKSCCLDRLLKDAFIAGLNSPTILSSILQGSDSMDFRACVEKAKLLQQLRHDAESMHSSVRSTVVHSTSEDLSDVHKINSPSTVPADYVCMRCGARAKHLVHKCFALNVMCNTCGKKGHISRVCHQRRKINAGQQQTHAKAHHLVHQSSSCVLPSDDSSLARCSSSNRHCCPADPHHHHVPSPLPAQPSYSQSPLQSSSHSLRYDQIVGNSSLLHDASCNDNTTFDNSFLG